MNHIKAAITIVEEMLKDGLLECREDDDCDHCELVAHLNAVVDYDWTVKALEKEIEYLALKKEVK